MIEKSARHKNRCEEFMLFTGRNKRILEGLIAVTGLATGGLSIYSFYNYSHLMGLYIGLAIGAISMATVVGVGGGIYCCASSFWATKKEYKDELTPMLVEDEIEFAELNLTKRIVNEDGKYECGTIT